MIYTLEPDNGYTSVVWAPNSNQAQQAAFPGLFASVSQTAVPRLGGKWNKHWELLDYKTTLDAEAEGFEVPDLPFGDCTAFASMIGRFIVCFNDRAYQTFKPLVESRRQASRALGVFESARKSTERTEGSYRHINVAAHPQR